MLLVCFYFSVMAQPGVAINITGTPPDPSAILDVSSLNKGILIPRIDQLTGAQDNTTIVDPATGLLIYSKINGGDPGFYYNSSTIPNSPLWEKLAIDNPTETYNKWRLTGNTGTNANMDYLGTTDNQDLVFRRFSATVARFYTGGAVVFSGNISTGVTPVTGPGTRMMWIPERASFRVGSVDGTQWDNIGLNSFAAGKNAKAAGDNSVALGNDVEASGTGNYAIGNSSKVTIGFNSFAIGNGANASGLFSFGAFAIGNNTISNGTSSFAFGDGTTAAANYSTAMGHTTLAGGMSSVAMGDNSNAGGNYSLTAGIGTKTNAYGGVALGRYNVDAAANPQTPNAGDRVFQIGDGTGTAPANRKDILWLTRPGNLFITGSLTANGVNYPSDVRLKTAITPLKNVLDNIDHIQPISYYFKDKVNYPATHQIGFSAQEIEKEFPELINKNDKGYLSVNYPQMTAVAIQGIKEQQEIIKNQQAKIHQQQQLIDNLSDQNALQQQQIDELKRQVEKIIKKEK